jgi:methylated-DNA-[protein]-cysteine S-methyltransferase
MTPGLDASGHFAPFRSVPAARKDDTTMNTPVHSSMVMPSPIGQLLMESSPMGLMRLSFLTDEEAATLPPLSLGLNPNSTGSSILVAAASQLGAYFAGKRRGFDLPLDLKGTDFQRSVWRAVLKIPFGEKQDVAWLASEIGVPGQVDDVAQAIGATPVPIIVPCHRVLGAAGIANGYVGGADRQQHLLTMEGLTIKASQAAP